MTDTRTDLLPDVRIGPLAVWPPVVLAPMAGITNAPFRRLCRSFATDATAGAGDAVGAGGPVDAGGASGGLFVSEMITARGLVERNDKTLRMARFADDEPVRSIQLYGTDPATIGEAVRILAAENGADHVDLNFGCPVSKVTRKGGGAALPVRRALFAAVVQAAVRAAGDVPVTVKLRVGVDDRLRTFLDAGRAAAGEGAAAVALHARTAEQHYSGRADWRAIAALVEALPGVPVLGNGDVWRASDAVRMMAETGCAGVVVGRGCLGRPWLFGDLARAAAGAPVPGPPPLGEVREVLRRHMRLLVAWLTEPVAVRDVRKHVGWYLHGYPVGGAARRRLATAPSLDAFEEGLDALDPTITAAEDDVARPRGKTSGPFHVTLPEGWLDRADDPTPPEADDLDATSGG
ncbi:MAG TPA: tRNA dihydrouridine synthase DusB [Acidimicrobiales bacterium]|nr:tRNA dihydrouridine synthase DusB [Acidimicrobiales bacterium]